MKTDRELLELAAKAAGVPLRVVGAEPGLYFLYKDRDGVDGAHRQWDPLTDDGDALRLAARLELDVMHRVVGGKRIEVLAAGGPLIQEFYEGEPYAPTRHAIVRAAAEVGNKLATKEA